MFFAHTFEAGLLFIYMKKALYIALIITILSACNKKESISPSEQPNNIGCNQSSSTLYDTDGKVVQYSNYFYSNGYLDSVVGINGSNIFKSIYTYQSGKSERRVNFFVNGVKQQNYSIEKLDAYGNITETYSVSNNIKGFVTKNTYGCN